MNDNIKTLGKSIMDAFRNKQPPVGAKKVRPFITFKGKSQYDADLFFAEKVGEIVQRDKSFYLFYIDDYYLRKDWEALDSELDHLEKLLEAVGWSVTWSEADTALQLLGPLQDAAS